MRFTRAAAQLAAAAIFCASAVVVAPAPDASASVVLTGAGSTWSQIAIDQFRADVSRQGLNINYQGVGSTSGRVFYYNDQVDFAVSEIPFTAAYRDSTGTVVVNEIAAAAHRPYAYLPIVAGGTSFMYHVNRPGGGLITDVQFSPDTIAKIFTGVITNWDDPQIRADNPGQVLPNLPIRVVVRSDGSGTTAQFTAFLASQATALWNAYCTKVGMSPCGQTSLFPLQNGSSFVSQALSTGVANFVGSSANNGAITYVEYGYAKQRAYPVASVKNRAGYFTQPTSLDVAIALQGASFNSDGTQNLQGVYTYGDPYTYPVSSYSYMIVPTTTAPPFDTAKGDVLGRFILYFACAGQQKAAELGYSPLPRNLVVNAFASEAKIPGAPAPPPIDEAHCANPTLTGNWPPHPTGPPPTQAPSGTGTGTGSGTGTGTGSGTGTGTGPYAGKGTGTRAATTTIPAGGVGTAGPGAQSPNGVASGPAGGGQLVAAQQPIDVPRGSSPIGPFGVVAAVLLLLAVMFVPPAFALVLDRRRRAVT